MGNGTTAGDEDPRTTAPPSKRSSCARLYLPEVNCPSLAQLTMAV
jgi:hypothetical protein